MLVRPWVPNRELRRQAGPFAWWAFRRRESVRCPECSGIVMRFGSSFYPVIRVHPERKLSPASQASGAAFVCPHQGCGIYLDVWLSTEDPLGAHRAVA